MDWWYKTTADADWTKLTGTSITVATDTDTTYSFKAISLAGLESTVVSQVVKVSVSQATAPNLNTNGYVSGTWTNSQVTFNLGTNSSNNTPFGGTARYEMSSDGGNSWQAITLAGSPATGSESGPDGSRTGAT